MVAAAILQEIELNAPGQHAVLLEADDLETYNARFPVYGAVFQPNRDNQASDSWGATFTAGDSVVTIRLTGTTTDVKGTLWLFGI